MNLRSLCSSRALALLAGVALAVTALSPQTGWLARTQLSGVFGGSTHVVQMLYDLELKYEDMPMAWALPAPQTERREAAYERTLATHSEDISLQLAGVMREHDSKVLLPRLRERAQVSDRPEWLIAALRCACRGELSLRNRAVEQELLSAQPLKGTQDRPIESAVFERGLADARRGGALDPSNAFFPAMEAITLYGLKRDTEAQVALSRAALCPRFDDGLRTEMQGALRLREAARGPQLALTETAVAMATLFPHYASFRALARVAVVQAMQKEQAGDLQSGLALRRSVMALGEKLGMQANSYIGTLVGNAMIEIAIARPGGAPAISAKLLKLEQVPGCGEGCSDDFPTESEKAASKARAEKVFAERLRQWEAFAKANGAEDLTATFLRNRERKAAQTVNFERTTERSVYGISRVMVQTFGHLMALNLLLSLSVVLLLGGIGKLLLRRWPAGKAAHPAISWGLALVFCPILLPVALWKLRKAEGRWARRLGMLLATWLVPYLLVALLVRAEAGAIAPGLALVGLMQGMSAGTSPSDSGVQVQVYLWMGLVGVTLTLPLLWLAGLALTSGRRRVPAIYGVARSAARSAVPLAAALCFVYALLLPFVARQERQLKQEIREMIHSETAYQARLAAQSRR